MFLFSLPQGEPSSDIKRLKLMLNCGSDCQQDQQLTDAVRALVVAGDGDVDELGGGVNVAEGDDGNVGVAPPSDGLLV